MVKRNHFHITYTSASGGRAGTIEATAGTQRMELETPAVVPGINIVGGPPGPDRNGGSWRAIKWWMFLEQQVPAFQCNILHALDMGSSPTWSLWRTQSFGQWIHEWQRQTEYPIPDNNRPDNGYPFRTIMNWWDCWQQAPGQRSRRPILFSDSAGNAVIRGALREKSEVEFGQPVSQSAILDLQLEMGADVLMSLDYPLVGGLSAEEWRTRRTSSIRNGLELLTSLSQRSQAALPLIAVHGTDRADVEAYLKEFMDGWLDLSPEAMSMPFGFALGSLHTRASQPHKIVDIMRGLRAGVGQIARVLGRTPLIHVLGISNRIMPILVYLGADTFNSQTYADAARRGGYLTRYLDDFNISEVTEVMLEDCGCFICSQLHRHGFLPEMKAALAPKSQRPESALPTKSGIGRSYRKSATGEDYTTSDLSGLLAMHNWLQISREIERVRAAVKQDCLPEYIWDMVTMGKPNPRLVRAVEVLAESEAMAGNSRLMKARGKGSPVVPGVPVPTVNAPHRRGTVQLTLF